MKEVCIQDIFCDHTVPRHFFKSNSAKKITMVFGYIWGLYGIIARHLEAIQLLVATNRDLFFQVYMPFYLEFEYEHKMNLYNNNLNLVI